MLGRLLDAAIADASFSDVHDRAMLYYRLLRHNPTEAEAVLCQTDVVRGQFVEEAPSELQVAHDRLGARAGLGRREVCRAS
jgi:hypothetical protein